MSKRHEEFSRSENSEFRKSERILGESDGLSTKNSDTRLAITLGDPCSIGAEITKKALLELFAEQKIDLSNFILIGNQKMFGEIPNGVEFVDIESGGELILGQASKYSGEVAYRSVMRAVELVKEGKIKAIVTAPISKYAINLAGHEFSGHTEIFDKYLSRGQEAQMLFVTGGFRVLLLTRHIPIVKVPEVLTQDFIEGEIVKLNDSLQKLGIENPKIALCGLNPHAGEEGLLGREEQEEFLPAIKNLQEKNIQIEGVFPADMLFAKAAVSYKKGIKHLYDCYVATYHDQGLCAVKILDLARTVNVTIGLDVLRTSPAHGTAFDIAGHGVASAQSMKQAILLALGEI